MKKGLLLFLGYLFLCCIAFYSIFINDNQDDYTNVENRDLLTRNQFLDKVNENLDFKNGVFQNQFQRLLNDQFPFRNTFLKSQFNYESLRSSIIASVAGNDEQPILFKNGEFYQINNSGYYISIPLQANDQKNKIFEDKMWNFDQIYNKYGEKYQLYIYKPTLADETDWFDETFSYPSEGTKYYSRLSDQLNGKYTVKQQQFDTIHDYMEQHYKTDHHWNHIGAYQGYHDIISMISNDFFNVPKPYAIKESYCYPFPFHGSLSMKVMGTYGSDSFCDYTLDNNDHVISIIDNEEKRPGLEEDILNENLDEIYIYEEYHGTNYKMIEYTNADLTNGASILILADSFSNSINDDLAKHFKKTYIVDPRAWTENELQMESDFSLDEFLSTHDVDMILWLQYYESLYFDSRMYMHIDLNY